MLCEFTRAYLGEKSEYKAMSRKQHREFTEAILPQSFCENQEVIDIAHKPVKNGRTTHNESHSHFM